MKGRVEKVLQWPWWTRLKRERLLRQEACYLNSLSIYNMGIYKWIASVIREGEKAIKNFLWSESTDKKKSCTVGWEKVCLPLKDGGAGIRRLKEINLSLLMKLAWHFLNFDDHWIIFMRAKFINKAGDPCRGTKRSSIWVRIRWDLPFLSKNTGWIIGNGTNIDLWRDTWCSYKPLKYLIENTDIHSSQMQAKLSSIISNSRKLPRVGEVKINSDGSSRDNPGIGGVGFITRGHNGIVLRAYSKGQGNVTYYMAECSALLQGLQDAASNGSLNKIPRQQ
ncbi:hypothetical protein GIB67_029502 [Kingdonia uniflora]|uniref:RNase H type-1 domain-containing protein n=1 Tax=Kingdonia uniflora TaxID=39325 RepID=A0A7J7NYR9_9MAGN|nr:hypothetical protein GIB67_029502 [Kingdonia uniflora]